MAPQHSERNKARRQLLLIMLVFYGAGMVLVFSLVNQFLATDREGDLNRLETALGQDFPADADDFDYNISDGVAFEVSFRASLDEAQAYVQDLCGEDAHAGYDPFNAIDSLDSPNDANAVAVNMPDFEYFSYSPNALDTTYGMRCVDQSQRNILQIRMTPLDDDSLRYRVYVFRPENCAATELPCDVDDFGD